VEGGVTNGQFEVPAAYNGNFIHVRAYTKWMLNFDTSFLYRKNIRILGKAPATAALPAVVPTLEFFPEGGDVLAGIKNRIAFKVHDQWGRPVKIRGTIQKDGAVIDSLKPLHDGMGYFYVIPEAGAKYIAKWKDPKGVERTTDLPAIKPSGVALQVALAPSKRYFNISRTSDAPEHLQQLHLVGTMQQNLVFKTAVNLTTITTTSGIIPTDKLPTGILTVTAFDKNWNAVAERITYINNNDHAFPTEMNVERWGLSKRAKNEIELTVPANIEANLSISVTDAAIETDSSNNIIAQLLLTGDLKGQVYKPSYYFSANTDSVAQHLDLVMLTHGWRRFKWEDVTKGKFPVITYPRDSTYLSLSGKLFGLSQGQLQSGGSLMMMVKERDSATKLVMAPVFPDGTFNDPEYIFFDTLRIHYQATNSLKGASVNFMTSRIAAPKYGPKSFGPAIFPDTTGSYRHAMLAQEAARIIEQMKGKTLETVTVQAKTKSPVQVLDEKYASSLFKGSDGYQFDLVNDPFAQGGQNIFNYLQGKVAGLQISAGAGTPSLQWRGGPPLLYLDEVSTDPSMLSGIPVTDIAYVKVFRPPFMGSGGGMYGNGSNGAIAIYTRRGNDVSNAPGKGLSGSTVAGYSPIRQFYSPNYASFDPRNEQRDVRTTLYWNPQVITGPNKNVIRLSFYNNDVSEAFRVVVEGMSKDGRLTHMETLME
jgi:hypothetical protein